MTANDESAAAPMLTRRRLCTYTPLVILCVVITTYYLFLPRQESDKYYQRVPDDFMLDLGFPTSKPYLDFIDPDSENFKRTFYSGKLVSKVDPTKPASPQVNVRVFTDKSLNTNHCVPFRVPGNVTTQICIYDPEVDRMISSYIRDNGVWEAEEVELMAELMLADDKQRMEKYPTAAATAQKDNNNLILAAHGNLQMDRNLASNVLHENIYDRNSFNQLKGPESATAHPGIAVVSSAIPRCAVAEGCTRMDSMSLVDVGSNIGVYSLSAAILGHQVLAIDPVQDSLSLLAASLQLTNLTSRATLILNAVSDHRGPVDVHVNPENVGGSSVAHRTVKDKTNRKSKRVVPVTSRGGAPVVLGAHRDTNNLGSQSGSPIEHRDVKDKKNVIVRSLQKRQTFQGTKRLSSSDGSPMTHRVLRDVANPKNVHVVHRPPPEETKENSEDVFRGSFAKPEDTDDDSKFDQPLRTNQRSKSAGLSSMVDQTSSASSKVDEIADASSVVNKTAKTEKKQARGDKDADPDLVYAICLDDVVPHVRTRRVFLKLDIEGWEARALRCASDFFQELDVRYVLMEWLFLRKSSKGGVVINFLVRNGFLPYVPYDDGDFRKGTLLSPESYYSWPDNVLWGKR